MTTSGRRLANTPAQGEAIETVLGIPVENRKTASLLRKVMSIASTMSLLALVSCVLQVSCV
jgi:hypothetical protein